MIEKHLYRFGDFSLNAEDHTLSREGESIPVTPKMFDLLLVMVQNPKRVLTKEFLLQSVWPDSFVEEGNITFNIRQLRKALGDDAQSPKFIETIPRRGYRFLSSVEATTIVLEEDPRDKLQPEAPAEPRALSPPRTRPYVFFGMVVFLVLAGAIGLSGWFLKGRTSAAPILSAPFKLEKLSTDGGVFHASLSPDGKNVVYTHRMSGKQSLWLRQLENSNNVLIIPPSDDFYGGLTISPDGNSVYFARGTNLEPQLNIYRMPIVGGVPQKVIESTQGWISLSSNGEKISFVRCPYTDEEWCSVYIADASDGKNEKKLSTRPRPMRIGDNKISPDGRFIAFAVGQSRTSSNEFAPYVVDIETGEERPLSEERFFNINYFTWLPDQSGLLMTALQLPDRHFRIWYINPASGETRKLTSDSETYSRLSLDATGTLLVSTQVEPDFRMTLFETAQPTMPHVLGDANTVAFAPDGRLYFSSARTGDYEIWSVNADGTDLKQLTNDTSADSTPMLSVDGRTLFFTCDRTGVVQIWQMNIDGTNQRQLTKDEGGFPVRISPDSKWLYYRSALKNNLRRVSIETGQEEIVLQEAGRGLTVSPDTTRIAYSQRRGAETELTVASIADGSTIKTWKVSGTPYIVHMVWSNDGESIAYVAMDDTRQRAGMWFQAINEDKPRQIADLSGDEIAELQSFALSNDGKSFAVIKGTWKHDAVLLRGLK